MNDYIMCGWSKRVFFNGVALRQTCGHACADVAELEAHVAEKHAQDAGVAVAELEAQD